MKILWCGHEFPVARRMLMELLPHHEFVNCPADSVIDFTGDAEVIIPAMVRIDAAIISAAPHLRLIHQFGAGIDGVDRAAALDRGITIGFVPAADTGNAAAVGEMAILQLLALTRKFPEARVSFSSGQLGLPVGNSLVGKAVTVLGLGSVGRAVATRLRPFVGEVIGVGRRPRHHASVDFVDHYYPFDRLHEALEKSVALIVCCPLTEQTRNMIGKREMESLPPGSYIINVARGAILDYEALVASLDSGHLAGAGLDVFWSEPFDPNDPLFAYNVIATPHLGGVTEESYRQMAQAVADGIERLAAGQPLLHAVTPD